MIPATHIVEPPLSVCTPFVLNSWLKSYEARGCKAHDIDRKTFYRSHHPEFTRLMRNSKIALVVTDEEPDAFIGWACGTPGVLHYVYVRSGCRSMGAARALVQAVCGDAPGVYTFEPAKRDGRVHRRLVEAATVKGWRFHPHPIPGVLVLKQKEAS